MLAISAPQSIITITQYRNGSPSCNNVSGFFNPLSATGANMHQVIMITDNCNIERVNIYLKNSGACILHKTQFRRMANITTLRKTPEFNTN